MLSQKYLVPISVAAGFAPLVFLLAMTYGSPAENNDQTDKDTIEQKFLRGAISDTSPGKQLSENGKTYLCETFFTQAK